MALWIIDTQPATRYGGVTEPIIEAIRTAGHEVVETYHHQDKGIIPEEILPLLSSNRPMILRGSVGFIRWAHAQGTPHPGGFPSEGAKPSVWLGAYGDLALNAGAVIIPYGDFEQNRTVYEEQLGGALFVKPADGSKTLCGTVVRPGQPLFDAHFSWHRYWPVPPDDFLIVVAPVYTILAEWRFVIAGNSVVARSQYQVGGRLETAPSAPTGAEELANQIANYSWRPTDVFVADIAQTDTGFYLLELNTFGTSGLYDCDLKAIVEAVSPYAE
jgi:ATP-grasp domain, R2K clade family 3